MRLASKTTGACSGYARRRTKQSSPYTLRSHRHHLVHSIGSSTAGLRTARDRDRCSKKMVRLRDRNRSPEWVIFAIVGADLKSAGVEAVSASGDVPPSGAADARSVSRDAVDGHCQLVPFVDSETGTEFAFELLCGSPRCDASGRAHPAYPLRSEDVGLPSAG